ncbi:MAG: hypothetical protein BGO98_07100 [Myxococcales bacterium 68-20]|nr:MAG: hypothetical protein BGO98_07100 [Myxococcales bacterium 68-20]
MLRAYPARKRRTTRFREKPSRPRTLHAGSARRNPRPLHEHLTVGLGFIFPNVADSPSVEPRRSAARH